MGGTGRWGMIGGSAVGRKGIAPEKVGEEAAEELIRGLEGGGCVDEVNVDKHSPLSISL